MSQAVIGWLIAIVVFIVAEAATVTLVSVWFIGGAVCADRGNSRRGTRRAAGGISRRFGGAAGVRVPGGSKKVGKKPERMNTDRLVGETAMVTEPIDACADTGAVKINGVLWTAKCQQANAWKQGGHVTIERVEGAKLYVKPAKCPCTKA